MNPSQPNKYTVTNNANGERLSFLSAVARAYASTGENLSELCFVFPNKRAGTFFLKALSEQIGRRTVLAPEVVAMPELMARISGREVASRIDLLFRLYNVYSRLMESSPDLHTDKDMLNFDRFAPWGETVVADFNEVDKYAADADSLFKNVRDYRDIRANFLTDEQMDVIERYFGYRPDSGDAERFWNTVDSDFEKSTVKERFVELWRVLPQLYTLLREDLERDGMTMEGTSYLQALQMVEEMTARDDIVLPWSRLVFVGFCQLSTTEARMFELLGSLEADDGRSFAEFYWDATGPVLAGNIGNHGAAVAAIRRNMSNFPTPDWAKPYMQLSDVDEMPPNVLVEAAPSNAAQVKIAAMKIDEWIRKVGENKIAAAQTAVVIPDENLLLPLIHSLPDNVGPVNLTMGYSMRYTSTASFVYHLRRLHMRRRSFGGEIGYYNADFRTFMSHPLVHLVVGTTTANAILTAVAERHLRVITPEWLAGRPEEGAAKLARILRPLDKNSNVNQTIDYISGVLDMVTGAIEHDGESTHTVNARLEAMQLALYQQGLARLRTSVNERGIEMHFANVFHLVDRLLAGEKVTFEGMPLRGLQIMGLLETRTLDFDHLIVLSMNDKIMPRRSNGRTFIPDSLRHAYGLPASTRGEELYAYYFYRMISRAKDVTLIYDARAGEGMRSGGKSRFLMQLEMLYDRNCVRHNNYSFRLSTQVPEAQGVRKTDAVMRRLSDYLTDDPERRRDLSASALMNYVKCPVWFYYKNVVGIKDEDLNYDFVDDITMGQIVHTTMLELYFPEGTHKKYLDRHIMLDAAYLDALLRDPERIATAVRRAVNREQFKLEGADLDRPLTGSILLTAQRLERMVRNAVECDRLRGGLELVGGEVKGNAKWNVETTDDSPALSVNMTYAIDRIDKIEGRLRIVDYKSGNADAKASEVEDIFSGKGSKYLLQLLLYAHLLQNDAAHGTEAEKSDIALNIFDVNRPAGEVEVWPKIGKEGHSLVERRGHRDVSDEFRACFDDMLRHIFNPDEDFEPTDDESNCDFCKFHYLCGRQ